ncbi:MAG: DUF1640 domain-containing protein [Cytophagales bacterium]|nr:DUF1640 domain-containing protein [Cytophagales bacterium]
MIAAGFTQQQAETQAEALAEIIDEQVVSRQYLDIRLRELEMRLTLRLGGMMVAGIAIVAALVQLL